MAEREAAPIMSLPDDLVLAVMERAAAACGTFAVLRGLASSRRRFQRLAYGESSKLFMEPAFVSGRQGPRPAGDTVLDVARLAARFGGRVERLHLRDVSFALRCAGAAEGEGEGESCAPPSSGEQPQDGAAAAAAAAGGSAGPPARADGILLEALCSCPNLTHLSFSGAGAEDAHRSLAALESLPSGFALPRLRHLDLCGHIVPLPAFRRLLGACSASLERLYLRGTRVVESAIDFSGEEGEAAREAAPYRLRGNVPIVHALDGLDFPRLASLDVSSSDDCAGADDLGGFAALRALHARLPALRDLAAVHWYYIGDAERGEWEAMGARARSSGGLVIDLNLRDMLDPAALRALHAHFDGGPFLRPEGSRLPLARLAAPAFLKAVSWPLPEDARRLVSELGVSPAAPLPGGEPPSGPWTAPHFRELDEAWGSSALHALARHEHTLDPGAAQQLIEEWGLAPLVHAPARGGASRGHAPLHLAASAPWPDMLEVLLELGADPLARDAAGYTALHVACDLGRTEAARTLLEAAQRAGTELELLSAKDGEGRTPLQRLLGACSAVRLAGRSRIAAQAVELLRLDGATLEALGARQAFLEEPRWGERGTEPLLHFATCTGTPEAVRALLDAGADPLLKDRDGATVEEAAERARRCAAQALFGNSGPFGFGAGGFG